MPKCPECGEEIDTLVAYCLEENKQTVELENEVTEKPILNWGNSEAVEGSCKKIQFECPECSAVLFTNNGNSNDDRVSLFLFTGEYKP